MNGWGANGYMRCMSRIVLTSCRPNDSMCLKITPDDIRDILSVWNPRLVLLFIVINLLRS